MPARYGSGLPPDCLNTFLPKFCRCKAAINTADTCYVQTLFLIIAGLLFKSFATTATIIISALSWSPSMQSRPCRIFWMLSGADYEWFEASDFLELFLGSVFDRPSSTQDCWMPIFAGSTFLRPYSPDRFLLRFVL
jgi:hypothetical protein